MRFFKIDWKALSLILIPVFLFFSMTQIKNDTDGMPWYVKPFAQAANLSSELYSKLSDGVRGTTLTYLNLIDTNKENRILKQKISELQAQFIGITEIKLENERLNKLLQFKEVTPSELLPAKVVASDPLSDHHSIIINRGSKDHVKPSMAVISPVGIVGYIVKVLPHSSQVILLYDRYSVVDAIVQRSRTKSLVEGWSDSEVLLSTLHRDDDVQVGDQIVTSGLNNFFPKGLPIGVITKVEKEPHGFTQRVLAEPFINKVNLEEVFVVLKIVNPAEDPLLQEETPIEEKIKSKEKEKNP